MTLRLGGSQAVGEIGREAFNARPWLAPELKHGVQASSASDVWSIGCFVVEMMTGAPPAMGVESRAFSAQNVLVPAPPLLPQELRKLHHSCHRLVQRCLVLNPASRPAACDLVETETGLGSRVREPASESEK